MMCNIIAFNLCLCPGNKTEHKMLYLIRHLTNLSRAVLRNKPSLGRSSQKSLFSTISLNGIVDNNNIVYSPFPDVPIPETNLYSYVLRQFDKLGNQTALVDAISTQEISFIQLKEETRLVSSGLRRMGLGKGDVVTVCAPNCIEYTTVFLATLAAGGIVSTCNPTYTSNELNYQIKNSNSKFVVTIPALLPTVLEAIKGIVSVEKIIVIDDSEQQKQNIVSFSSLRKDSGSLFEEVKIDSKNDIAVLPYSSGTTGLPKGVMLSHYNLIANLCQIDHPELMHVDSNDSVLGLLPFFHIYGMIVILLYGLSAGAKDIILPKFEPDSFLSAIQNYKISKANLVPPLVLFLAKHPLVDSYNISSLKSVISGAAPLGGDLVELAKERTGIDVIRQGYGLTETSPVSHVMPFSLGMAKSSSIGPPICNQKVKIVDVVTGETVGPNVEGEVMMAGPNIMLGYLNHPTATKESITDDGWFHTGDIGYFDDEGHFYITDRLKELIKVKGLQVAPAELEALLQHHPKITDAAVIGIPDERQGEAPKAFVVRDDSSLTEEDIISYVKERVAEHKWLVGGVEFIDAVPKSASGKILRRNLKN